MGATLDMLFDFAHDAGVALADENFEPREPRYGQRSFRIRLAIVSTVYVGTGPSWDAAAGDVLAKIESDTVVSS